MEMTSKREGARVSRAAGLALASFASCVFASSLEEGFKTPPPSAKPQTWYHMMNGNVTKEGVTRDFEELAQAGFGGVQIFDVGCDIPPGEVAFGSDEWFAILRHAHNEAKRLGLMLGIHNCSGWSSSGGPWVTPADAMKVTMHSEIVVKGPTRFSRRLSRIRKDNGFYADIAVLAYPTPEGRATLSNANIKTGRSRKGMSVELATLARDTKEFPAAQVIAKDRIVDLTAKMSKDGTLTWDVPAGKWSIFRLGYICNGRRNRLPATTGDGLEVDKLSAEAFDRHFDAYMGRLCRELGMRADDVHTTGLSNIHVDSWEVGCQNWTHGLEKIFERRVGYSILPYLPVLAGHVVGSVDESERFCEDFRRLLADLLAENYAGRLAARCHEHGLAFSCEPYGPSNADDFQYGEKVDIPMSCFWMDGSCGPGKFPCFDNSHYAASLAHVWGRRYAADEAFTSGPPNGGRWLETPFSIKWQNDRAFANGCNLIVYHRFTHQPWADDRYLPGMTMGRWGMHLDRTQTWWRFAGGWFRYQARCQWMLQEGRFCADALFWGGEEVPKHGWPKIDLPKGYAFDACGTKTVELLKVKDGKVVVPGGVAYEILVLPDGDTMSERLVRKVGELLDAGARVVAPRRPARMPGMKGRDGLAAHVQPLVKTVWAKGVMECPPAEALKQLGVAPDFASDAPDAVWIHRRDESADWYFVARGNAEAVSFETSFRVTGKVPEIWNAETGEIADAAEWRVEGGRTVVRLDFPPKGSAFVVFRNNRACTTRGEGERPREPPSIRQQDVTGPWAVTFPIDWYTGGTNTKTVTWAFLKDWTTDADPDIKYFSGTATYRKSVKVGACGTGRVILDLGAVKDFAEVKVNGTSYPPLWRPPFRIDITDALVQQQLDIEIRVANLWSNRLIGDDLLYPDDCEWKLCWHGWQKLNEPGIKEIPAWVKAGRPSPTGRYTFTTWKHWTKEDKLLPSGLLGPVRIATTGHCAAPPLEIAVRGTEPAYTIVVPERASPVEKYAAEELQGFLEKVTGTRLPVVTDAAPLPKKAILLGETRHSRALLGGAFDPKSLGSDGFRLAARPPHLVAYGSAKRGALYAAYEILETYAGCRWYASWHSVIPKRDTVSVPGDLDDVQVPAFEMRESYWYDINRNRDFSARLRQNGYNCTRGEVDAKYGGDTFRFGGGLGSCHTFNALLPPNVYFDTHPEYFSLVKGKRRKDHTQLCLTNPDVLRIVTSNVLARIRKDPGAKFYGVSQNDWRNYCECEKCAAIDAEEESHAGTMVRFVNAIAEAVEKEFPDAVIETLAYQYTRKPPKKTRLRHNVMPCLCTIECDFTRPIPESPYAEDKSFMKDICGWKTQTDQLYLWDYVTEFQNFTLPFPNVYALKGNLQFFRDNNVKEIFAEGAQLGRHGEFAELKGWLLAKLMWNPDQEVEPLIADFFAGYYGKAAPFIREYFEEMHKRQAVWSADPKNPLRIWRSAAFKSLPDDFVEWAKPLWKKAVAAVKDDPALSYNVRMSEFAFDFLRLERMNPKPVRRNVLFAPCPEDDVRIAEAKALAKSLLDRMDEAKDISLSESRPRHDALVAGWKVLVASATNAPVNAIETQCAEVEESQLRLVKPGIFGTAVDDPKAGDGKALKLFNTHYEWCTTFPMNRVKFKPGAKYKIRVRVRVEKVRDGGEAFWAGVYDPVEKKGLGGVQPRTDAIKDAEYAWYDVRTWTPRADGKEYFWIGPGRFGKDGKSNIKALYIDKIELSEDPE